MTESEICDLNLLERELLSRRVRLIQRLNAIQQDFRRGRSADSEERALEAENEETLLAIEAESEDELALLDRALKKLQTGVFGHCEKCGDPIALKRLSAVPHATHCFDCAEGEKACT